MTNKTLLLEDHPDTQIWLSEIIKIAFPETIIDFASDIATARIMIEATVYQQAIIDLSLPDGNGVEIIRLLSIRQPETNIAVATIFDDEEHLLSALRAGAKGYVLKDQPREALVRVLQGMAQGEPPLSPSVARRMLDFFETTRTESPTQIIEAEVLTMREAEVLEIIARGASKIDVANSLRISPHTVGSHIKSIYRKLGISSRAEASLAAKRLGLLES